MEQILLTDEEIKQIYRSEKFPAIFNYNFEGKIAKAAQLKLIEWLEAGKFLLHQQWIGNSTASEWECFPNCWLCELKKQLRER